MSGNYPVIKSVQESEVRWGRPLVNFVWHCTASSLEASVEDILTFWKTPKCPGRKKCPYIPNVQGGMGWDRPGYHYLIPADGSRHILAPWSQITWGVKGFNRISIHAAWVGGANGVDNRTPAQKQEMLDLTREIKSILQYPLNILGHRDLSPDLNGNRIIEPQEWIKLCPSMDVRTWLAENGI